MAHLLQTRYPNSVATNPDGDNNWAVYGQYSATTTLDAFFGSDNLVGRGFDFNIPATSTITGVSLTIYIGDTTQNFNLTNRRLWYNSAAQGTAWTDSEVDTAYGTWAIGGDGDLVGLTTTTLTPQRVNSSGFGAGFSAGSLFATSTDIQIDYLYLTVWYQIGQGGTRSRRRDMRRKR